MLKSTPLYAALFAAALWTSTSTHAQVLADRIPADAVLYAGWAGTDALGKSYDASHFKGFLVALDLTQFVSTRIQQEIARQNDPQKAADTRVLQDWLSAVSKSPTAFYAGTIDFTNPAQPVPHLALFSKVGNAKAIALAESLNALFSRHPAPQAPPHGAIVSGDYLIEYIGDAQMEQRLLSPLPAADSLAATETFKQTLAQLGPAVSSSAMIIYFDAERALKLPEAFVRNQPDPQVQQVYPVLIDALGITSLRQAAWSGGFDGANWQSSAFVGMSELRKGLLSFIDNPPLDEAHLKLIPQSATAAGVVRFDGSRLLADIQDAAGRINDSMPRQLERIYQQVFAVTGVDVKADLLPSLGDEFIYYGSPDAAGNSLRGFTIANKLKDEKKAETSLSALENFISILILQRAPAAKVQFRTEPLPAPFDSVIAHIITTEAVTPAWAIHDGTFYFSMSLPALQSALEMSGSGGKGRGVELAGTAKTSLLDNPQFMSLRQKVGQEKFSSFAYADLPKAAPETYELITRAINQAALLGPPAPAPFKLPPLDRLTPHLGPMLQLRWSDAEGFHVKESAPFPLAGALSPSQLLFLRLAELVQTRRTGLP